ncbi:DNA-directed polymerase [Podospora aff. communis PSN243]|uniref:DNA polymerase kappa n=1 Tax=Podospora aff. communis PSN243 TaxID=3040156 RepID=A0AAV9GW44_9PEZI|nr:DNA-directed polymerase [Podospora aff. communis PSN243]
MTEETPRSPARDNRSAAAIVPNSDAAAAEHASLKYSLLGPSLTKAGQESVDQSVVSEVIYNASKGSKYFNREEERDKSLTVKIEHILIKKRGLEELDLSRELRAADRLIAQLESSRDLTQHIVHVDCDAFYAAVELLDRPELEDVPFAVGGGVLTTCNYVARKFGCRSGMAGFVAKKLCPELILLPLNFDKYNAKAAEVRGVIAEYDPRFESASIDEAYLNITQYCAEHDLSPEDAVYQMRKKIHEKTHITVSAGIAANTRLAKICSNMNKPNGQYYLPSDREAIMDFMAKLPPRKVNGVGRVFERELAAVGIETCADIYPQRQYISRLFGEKAYEFLIRCYLGLGRTVVRPAEEYERKSIGTESTFRDMSDPKELRDKLKRTAVELEKDMRRAECKGRTLCLKVKLHTFEVLTRQVVLPRAINTADDLYSFAHPMLGKLERELPGMTLRLMGLRCTHLVSTKPPDTLAFFCLRRRPDLGESKARATSEEEEWEQWPEEAVGDGHGAEEQLVESREGSSGAESPYRRHGKEIIPNPKKEASVEDELWDCPICGRPQPADERQFNDHIDLCLSRKTILDTVQQEAAIQPATGKAATPEASKKAVKKRGRQPSTPDPKQKRLCFG